MATMLETPSRIWRRIEAIEDRDMPSLPSLPSFEDSAEAGHMSSEILEHSDEGHLDDDLLSISSPIHSTPAASMHHTATSTIRHGTTSSTSSTARFATSLASRSSKSSLAFSSSGGTDARRSNRDSFDISKIPSLPSLHHEEASGHYSDETDEQIEASLPNVYLPPSDEDYHDDAEGQGLSITDALQSISRPSSPPYALESMGNEGTPKKVYDYSVSLRSEPKPSPFDKYRNVALRKTTARTRTPSLSRTTSSPTSSPTNSTPQSNRSIALPRSNAASPISAIPIPLPRSATASPSFARHLPEEEISLSEHEASHVTQETDIRSMDITDVHISPPRIEDEQHTEDELQESGQEDNLGSEEHECNASGGEREPTFSSEGDPTPYARNRQSTERSPESSHSHSLPSPAQSAAFTPTPAFPRPRARFNFSPPPEDLPVTPAQHDDEEQQGEEQHQDMLTPHTRRRSFLLSVINSTARPRMKFPTPHPRNFHATPSIAESTPATGAASISGTNLQSAFVGVTPRPRLPAGRRQSHPLSQVVVPSPSTSESESVGAGALGLWATPAHSSPYDGAGDRASFISTASSHDLTTHHRVNTSFDPAMGFGAGGQGLGRFDAVKLNNYLHGLNRRLEEENQVLLDRLRKTEGEKNIEASAYTIPSEAGTGRRLSGANRRLSAGTALGNVEEDMAEGLLEEKAELEEEVEALRSEVARCLREKQEVEQALDKEKAERQRESDRWKERMEERLQEVNQDVSGVINNLEQRLHAAEKATKNAQEDAKHQTKEFEKQMLEVHAERDVAIERAKKAEKVLESGRELGGELREANERIGHILTDLRNANAQINDLEEEVMRSDARIDELENSLRDNKQVIARLDEELNVNSDALASERQKIGQLEAQIRNATDELQATKAFALELEEGAAAAVEQNESLQDELASAHEAIQRMTAATEYLDERLKSAEGEAERAQELGRQLEDALVAAEKNLEVDEDALCELKTKVAALEREREKLLEKSASKDISHNPFDVGPTDADVETLENELDDANREIARLNTILNQSPARKAMDKAKEAKIQMLEREKEELLERNKALRMTVTEINTPGKVINSSGISPFHRQVLSMSVRGPRTPGAPLRDLSWLNSTANDPSLSPLVGEIHRLQSELDRANESIDDKLDKLEDAGLGVVGLTKKLEDARSRIIALEDEIARLTRREERRLCRLERARCQKCKIKVDLRFLAQGDESSLEVFRDSLPTEPPTPPTRTTEALKGNLLTVNNRLASLKKQWEVEKSQLLGEQAVLQDATSRLNTHVKTAKEEARKVVESQRVGEKTRSNVQNELEKAKRTIFELEADLKSERSRLRSLTTEHDRTQREKKEVLSQIQRTESDMDDVRQQLTRLKQENYQLEKELRENSNAEQKARLLEGRVDENAVTIDQLRQERSLLAADHRELQRKFSEISETANRLRDEYAAHSTSHDHRRHQLDLHLLEIEDLRRALDDQGSELRRVESEKDRIAAEKSDVARTVAVLEADLKRVKRDAESFGRDLKLLRTDKERLEVTHQEDIVKAERYKKQTQTQIRLLNEQLDNYKDKTLRAREELKNHICAADDRQLSAIKLQHNKECKGLIVQIRYLKAKFTRESSFRSDLVYQKQYLLVLLSQFEKSEQTIFASIARIGFPVAVSPPAKKQRKLKTVAQMVMFLNRARRASATWREQSSSKQAVVAALEDVRRRRATAV